MSVTTTPKQTNQADVQFCLPTTPKERRTTTIISGVWLVFLLWTVFGLLNATAPLWLMITAWTALGAFPFVHLAGFAYPMPFPRYRHELNTLGYCLALTVLGIIMALVVPTAIINIAPYVMSQWIFNHSMRAGLIATALTIAAVLIIVLVWEMPDAEIWLLPSVLIPALIMLFARLAIEIEARQQQRAEQLALAQQRDNLASTVHDVLGHSLTTITVKIQLAQRLLEANPTAAKTELAEIESLARKSLSEVRAAVTDLQQPDITEQLAQAAQSCTAAQISFHPPAELPHLGLVQQQTFAWVIREAVTNVIRHAQATKCTVHITLHQEQALLRIDDDGVGIATTDPKHHHGLAGLQRRVTQAGGTLTLNTLQPGTRVEVLL